MLPGPSPSLPTALQFPWPELIVALIYVTAVTKASASVIAAYLDGRQLAWHFILAVALICAVGAGLASEVLQLLRFQQGPSRACWKDNKQPATLETMDDPLLSLV